MSGPKTNRYGIGNYTWWPSSFLGTIWMFKKVTVGFGLANLYDALTLLQLQELLVQKLCSSSSSVIFETWKIRRRCLWQHLGVSLVQPHLWARALLATTAQRRWFWAMENLTSNEAWLWSGASSYLWGSPKVSGSNLCKYDSDRFASWRMTRFCTHHSHMMRMMMMMMMVMMTTMTTTIMIFSMLEINYSCACYCTCF